MRIGLFGGSFNPPHQGHVYISKLAIKKLGLDQVWWVIAKNNPLKEIKYDTVENRMTKCSKIVGEIKKIRIKKSEDIFTYDLVRNITRAHPRDQFFFIAGADILKDLHRWKNFKKLLKLISFAFFARGNFLAKINSFKSFKIYQQLKKSHLGTHSEIPSFLIFRNKTCNASSTALRAND